MISSTWSPRSLFGGDYGEGETNGDDLLPWLLSRLATELPADEYRTTAVLHPNIWYGHGPGQVRAWLDSARQAGLDAIDPLEGWRQALIAADCVLGDHSSVTYYAASIGIPVLLGAFPEEDLDPLSPVAALGCTAPRLLRHGSVRAQIDRTIASHEPGRYASLAEQTSSSPGESATLLRRLFYDLIGIPEPEGRSALLDPLPLPPYEPAQRTAPIRVLTRVVSADPPEVTVLRHTWDDFEPEQEGSAAELFDAAHTAVDESTRDISQLRIADVIVRRADEDDPRVGPPDAWTSEALAQYPYCGLAAYIDDPDRCVIRTREGELMRLTAAADPDGRPDLCDPAAYASALYAWVASGKTLNQAVPEITVWAGTTAHRVTIEYLTPPPQ
ncbi:hypothetical protein [Streptomyces sp. NPDC002845]